MTAGTLPVGTLFALRNRGSNTSPPRRYVRTLRGLSLLWCAGDSRMELDKTKCTPRAGSRLTSPLRFSLKNRSVILTSIRFLCCSILSIPSAKGLAQNCVRSKLHKGYAQYYTKNTPPRMPSPSRKLSLCFFMSPLFLRVLRALCGRTFPRASAPPLLPSHYNCGTVLAFIAAVYAGTMAFTPSGLSTSSSKYDLCDGLASSTSNRVAI